MTFFRGANAPAGGRVNRLRKSLGSPALGTTTAVHAAVTDNGSQQVITTGITQPDVPRCLTVTAGGTAGDIKAISVTIAGTDAYGNAISEAIGPFDADTAGTKTGSKAFATVTSITIPAHDGTGATTAVGRGPKIGLGELLSRNQIDAAYLNGVRETTPPTVAFSSSAVSGNTVQLASALAGTEVIVEFTR